MGERFTMNYWLYLFSFIFCNRLVLKPKDGNAFFQFFVGFTDMVLVCYRPGYATALGNLKIHTQRGQLLLGFVFLFFIFFMFFFFKSFLQPHRVTPGRPLNKACKAVFRDAQQSIQWRCSRWPAAHLAVSSCCQPGKLVNQILRNGYSFTFFFWVVILLHYIVPYMTLVQSFSVSSERPDSVLPRIGWLTQFLTSLRSKFQTPALAKLFSTPVERTP